MLSARFALSASSTTTLRSLHTAVGSSVVLLAQEAAGAAAAAAGTPSVMSFSLTCPHDSLYKSSKVHHVIIPTITGYAGVGAGHVATIAELRPGVVSVFEGPEMTNAKKFFVSGGFASVNADSTVDVNVIEAVPTNQIDAVYAKAQLDKYTAEYASAQNDVARYRAQIGVDVHTALVNAAE